MPGNGRGKKYIDLLSEKQTERWYRDCVRGSQITADVNLRRLGFFCEWESKTPIDLLGISEDGLSNLISDFIGEMEDLKKSPNYINSIVKPVKSWLTFNGKKLVRKIKIKDSGTNTKYGKEQIPTQEQLKKIFDASDTRSKVACSLMAFSGFRPEVIGNYMGNDGLKIKDFPEIHIDNKLKSVTFDNEITLINVRKELSKTKKPYVSFLGYEGKSYLQSYLTKRMIEGEELTQETPIIVPSKFKLRNKHISTINIGDIIRKSIRSAGLMNRPYILRSYFDTQLMMGESKGFIIRDYRVFIMGHSGNIEHKYTLEKTLTVETIEDMRQSYGKCLKFIETEYHGITESDSVKILRESTMNAIEIYANVKLSEEQRNELMALNTDEFNERLREIAKKSQVNALNNGNSHKTIPEPDLESYLNKSWELVQIYPKGDKAVIRLPDH
ncbi:MAG: site-specific integrase [Cuniculiplasma sp.]